MDPNNRVRIVVPGDDPPQIQGSPHLERLEPYGDLKMYTDHPADLETRVERVKDAEVIINTRSSIRWPREALERLPRLRLIATCSIGTDAIDLETATRMGVAVSNQPGRTAGVVAEHLFGLMFAVAKRAAVQTAEIRAGRWGRMDNIFLQGKTIGVVGTGNVGRDMARLANAIGMKVIAWTYNPSEERAAELGVRYVDMETLLKESDVVSLHVRLSDDSRHMLGERELGMMKRGALLVNGGRGELVDMAALVSALDSGHLGGAALDVFDMEPVPVDHPILACQQVVLTPHMADMTPEGIELLNEGVVDNIIAFLEGDPRNIVNG